jgi:AcrR family transcriptional regulator
VYQVTLHSFRKSEIATHICADFEHGGRVHLNFKPDAFEGEGGDARFRMISMRPPTPIKQIRQELESHLEQFDWSGLTTGRKNILNAFLKVATAEGYSAVTMRRLAQVLEIRAPSIYSHFPGGRDEIVGECLRWHYYNFGTAVSDAIKPARNVDEFLNALVTIHLSHQIQRPENHLWDLLVASDRIGAFLSDKTRSEVDYWISLCSRLYEAAAYEYCDTDTKLRAMMALSLLDSAKSWGDWNGKQSDIERLSRNALLAVRNIFTGNVAVIEPRSRGMIVEPVE